MEKKIEDNPEIEIDFKKILLIIWQRKISIIVCFIVFVLGAAVLTQFMDKKYLSEAKILINKTNSTNLADINPFIISDLSSRASGVSSLLGVGSNLASEIEIIKSPLVIDRVIKENNLRYEKGPKQGEFISTETFLQGDISIKEIQKSKIIVIGYKSQDPETSYNIVKSIIKNYKEVYENINSRKASNDRKFIEESYLQAKKSLENKISKLKNFKGISSGGVSINYGVLSLYDKKLGRDIKNLVASNLKSKKAEIELEQDIEKLKMLKTKYEWISLVENLSKNVTNVVVLKRPELRKDFEYKEPLLEINLLLGAVLGVIFSLIIVLYKEITDSKLTLSEIDDKMPIVLNKKFNINELESQICLNNINSLSIISLTEEKKKVKFLKKLEDLTLSQNLQVNITSNSSIPELIKTIKTRNNLILLSQVNYTDKNTYKQIKSAFSKLNKEAISEFVYSS